MPNNDDREYFLKRVKEELESEGEDLRHLLAKVQDALIAFSIRIAMRMSFAVHRILDTMEAIAAIVIGDQSYFTGSVGTKTGDKSSSTTDSPSKKDNGKRKTDSTTTTDKGFTVSIAHPKLLSKRFESLFVLQLFLKDARHRSLENIKSEFDKQEFTEHLFGGAIKFRQKVDLKLSSPDFAFSGTVTKILDSELNKVIFIGKPTDSCESGVHRVLVSIVDHDSGVELESHTIRVQVVDFAFDHVSRPLLSKSLSMLLAIGSFVMFGLSLLEQIDKTIGLTSGTAAAVLATYIYANFYSLFQRVQPNNPKI